MPAILVTVTAEYLRQDQTPGTGRVRFDPAVSRLASSTGGDITFLDPIIADLDASGRISVQLAATDDPSMDHVGWTWRIVEVIDGERHAWSTVIPYNATGGTVDLADLTEVATTAGALTYVTSDGLAEAIDDLESYTDAAIAGLGTAATRDIGTGASDVAAGDAPAAAAAAAVASIPSGGSAGTASLRTLGTGSLQAAAGDDARIVGAAQKNNNLSDLTDAATARTNLGLGDAATKSVGTTAGTVAAGDDSRITGAAQKANNLSDVASALTARGNLAAGHDKRFYVTFAGGVADQKVDVYFTAPNSFSGYIDIEITAGWSSTNAYGKVSATYALVANSAGTISASSLVCNQATGNCPSHFSLMAAAWDAGASRYKLTIAHISSTGNYIGVSVRARQAAAAFDTAIPTFGIGAVYTTDTTVVPALVPWQQPLDADLTAYAGLTTTGLVNRTGAGTVATVAVGTTAGTVAAGDDSRLSDARTPVAHEASHRPGGADALTGLTATNFAATSVDGVAGTASLRTLGTGATQAAAGDSVVRLTGDQTVAGIKTLSSHPLVSAGLSAGSGSQRMATEAYILGRGDNLAANGSGSLRTSFPFNGATSMTFDPSETYAGPGSLTRNSISAVCIGTELIPVDGDRYYKQSVMVKSGNYDGSEYNASRTQYYGLAAYDTDSQLIGPQHFRKYSGSANATLLAQLNPGDLTATLDVATGWYSGPNGIARNILWWPYFGANGTYYAPYTYSRNSSGNYSSNATLGMWAEGGISGTTITLRVPWAGPTLPAGTPVFNNNNSGSVYKYVVMSNVAVPNSWTYKSGIIGGWDTDGTNATNLFPYGTAYVAELIIVNNTSTLADNRIRYSMRYFGTCTSANMETATSTSAGVVTAPATSVPGLVSAPATSTSTGVPGQFAYSSTYFYVCVATNSWKRFELQSW